MFQVGEEGAMLRKVEQSLAMFTKGGGKSYSNWKKVILCVKIIRSSNKKELRGSF